MSTVVTIGLSRNQVRDVDRRAIDEYGMSGLVLMENAGRGCVDLLVSLGVAGPVAICCGRGNNGGDGLVIARHLELRGIAVRVLLFAEPAQLSPDAAANYRIVRQSGLPLTIVLDARREAEWSTALNGCDWVVDALLGTGTTGAPRPPLDLVIETINRAPARRLAIDLPSGLDCDTGEPSTTTIRADCTATFVATKLGFANPAARSWLGAVHVIDIGAPRRLLAEFGVEPSHSHAR